MTLPQDTEEWKELPEYEDFDVSNFGRVRLARISHLRKRMLKVGSLLKSHTDQDNYQRLGFVWEKTRKDFYVHNLVLMTFVGPRPEGCQGCHNDGNPQNNHISNLRWDTCRANKHDSILHGTWAKGTKIHLAKLTEGDIPKIYQLREEGLSQEAIGKIVGVNQTKISDVLNNKTWRHVPRPPFKMLAK